MSELKPGDEVYVSNLSNKDALITKTKMLFVADKRDFNLDTETGFPIIVMNQIGSMNDCEYAVKVPEKKLIPYTLETFPKGMVWVRNKGDESRFLIVSINCSRVYFGQVDKPYEVLMDYCELSLDGGKTWQPAGIEQMEG